MVIKYKEIKKRLKEAPLSDEELKIIKKIENYIDKKILAIFDDNEIRIDLCIVNFLYMPGEDRQLNLKKERAIIMRTELDRRYCEAGWKISILGSNMSELDYWIIKGKK